LLSCLIYYFENQKVALLGCIAYAALSLFIPIYVIYLPLLLYDLIKDKYQPFALMLPALFLINAKEYTLPVFLFTMLLMFTAILLKIKTVKLYTLQTEYNELRDTSTSYQRLLEEKNRSILKNQDYEISLATLNERNRISKELHDSIGHMLSRAILQVGALITITKDEVVSSGLIELKNTLSSGMDDIRKSIHNMYDESVDLYTQTEDSDIEVVGTGYSGAEAVDMYKRLKPDILLMDIRMENMSGLEAGEAILNEYPDAKILYLTTFLDDDYIIKALSIGAKGYMLKQNYESIIPSIKAVYMGQNVYGNEIITKLPNLMTKTEKINSLSHLGITEREFEIIKKIADGLSNKEISEALYLSEGTVRNNISNILDKLGLRDRTQIAVYYYKNLS